MGEQRAGVPRPRRARQPPTCGRAHRHPRWRRILVPVAIRTLMALDSHTYGFALQEHAWPFPADEAPQTAAALAESLPADIYPNVASVVEFVMTSRPGELVDFEIGSVTAARRPRATARERLTTWTGSVDRSRGPWFEDDDRGLLRPPSGHLIESFVVLGPSRPEPRPLVRRRGPSMDGARTIDQFDGRVRLGLEVEPPRGLGFTPAVHGHGHQVGSILEVAEDRGPWRAGASPTVRRRIIPHLVAVAFRSPRWPPVIEYTVR